MVRVRQALPLDCRTEARQLLHPELIAAVSRRPLATTRTYLGTWLAVVERLARIRGPIVFDWFVVGPTTPLLLELAHELRLVRQAERRGDFDDEEEHWYDEHPDDEIWEPPTAPERVVAALEHRPGFGPLATRHDVQWVIGKLLQIGPDDVFDAIEIGLTTELLLADIADVTRIGELALVDGLLPFERGRSTWVA